MSKINAPTKPYRKYWSNIAKQALHGKTITNIQYANKAMLNKLKLDLNGESILLITFSDNTTWAVASDDEFNGAGSLHLVMAPDNMDPSIHVLPGVPADD